MEKCEKVMDFVFYFQHRKWLFLRNGMCCWLYWCCVWHNVFDSNALCATLTLVTRLEMLNIGAGNIIDRVFSYSARLARPSELRSWLRQGVSWVAEHSVFSVFRLVFSWSNMLSPMVAADDMRVRSGTSGIGGQSCSYLVNTTVVDFNRNGSVWSITHGYMFRNVACWRPK